MKAIMRLKGLSVLDKSEKNRTKKIARQLCGEDVDLEDVFKDAEKEKKDKEMQ